MSQFTAQAKNIQEANISQIPTADLMETNLIYSIWIREQFNRKLMFLLL